MRVDTEDRVRRRPDPVIPATDVPARNDAVAAPTAPRSQDPPRRHWLERSIVTSILLVLGSLLAVSICSSLSWRIRHDLPLDQYSAFMHIEHGTVPFKGLFEISFPGTLLVHVGIARLFGYGDRGLMIANLVWFVVLAVVTLKLMAPLGRLVAWGALLAFGVAYFGCDARMVLPRDCILILPLALALLVHSKELLRPWMRRGVVGGLLGCAALVKPHAALALLPFLASDWLGWRSARRLDAPASGEASKLTALRRTVTSCGTYAFGFAAPWVLTLAWLASTGGLVAWWEMVRAYLPLYLQMDGSHTTLTDAERLRYVARKLLQFGGHSGYFLAAGMGSLLALQVVRISTRSSRLVGMLLAEAVVFAIYPALAGQFWDYHYLPFVYFMASLSSLCLVTPPDPVNASVSLLPKLAIAVTLLQVTEVADSVEASLTGKPAPPIKLGQVDEIAAYLQRNLRPGDTVQPLDWTGGVVHAMLIARATLATRFMYDFHFYHHVSDPFVQQLRRRFLDELEGSRPRFIIEYFGDEKPWPLGVDTTREFPELQQLLASKYEIRSYGLKYRIHERLHGP